MYREERKPGSDFAGSVREHLDGDTIEIRDEPRAEAPARPIEAPAQAKRVLQSEEKPGQLARAKKPLVILGILAALGAAVWYGTYWFTLGQYLVTTDDAYVGAHNTTLAAKVSGYIAAIPVEDNQHLKAGQLIARIDDGDYRLAVTSARNKIEAQQATVERTQRQVTAAESAVVQAKAQAVSEQANLTRSQLEFDRQRELSQKQFGSRQAFERARAGRDQAQASVENANAAITAAEANVDVTKAQSAEAEKSLQEIRTQLAKAERDLSFTEIKAPVDGVIGNRAMQVGDYVQPGQRLATLVPLSHVYVDANFNETQLRWLKPGQKATIAVDARPDHDIVGIVESFAPASGSVFSLLPPENATGNFTKIVQRVPIRIAVPEDVARSEVLKPGLSVVVSVHTGAAPTAPDRVTRPAQAD